MYTIQALWTMARESLDITAVIWANRTYQILKGELANVGAGNPGRKALDMLDIGRPDLNFVDMARGMGVDGERVEDCEGLIRAMRRSNGERGPYLIEVLL